MNKQYETINFGAFFPEEGSLLTEAEEKIYIENFYKSTGIQQDEKGRHKSVERGIRRRFAVLLAAAIMIMAFGTIAYAAGFLQLGTLRYSNGSQAEFLALDDSAQHKAAQEALDYEESLSKKERIAMEESECDGGFEQKGTWNDHEKSVTYKGPSKKMQELLDKYHLEYERTHYYVDSAQKAFEKAGIGNVLGDFRDIDALKSNDGNVYDDGYTYTDKGSVTIMGDEESADDHVFWELHVIPNNVYLSPWALFLSAEAEEKENEEFTQWDFVTADGYAAKAYSYKGKHVELKNDEEVQTYDYDRGFQVLIPTQGYLVNLFYNAYVDDPKHDISNQEFEELVDKLDFSALPIKK